MKGLRTGQCKNCRRVVIDVLDMYIYNIVINQRQIGLDCTGCIGNVYIIITLTLEGILLYFF